MTEQVNVWVVLICQAILLFGAAFLIRLLFRSWEEQINRSHDNDQKMIDAWYARLEKLHKQHREDMEVINEVWVRAFEDATGRKIIRIRGSGDEKSFDA